MPVLYCIRHGETDLNAAARLQGRRDILLNAHGWRQAAECGDELRRLFARERRSAGNFAYVASPLRRAGETMEGVRAVLGVDPRSYAVDDRLMEVSYGEWEGLTLPEIEARAPGALAERERDKWDFAPPGGESYRDLTRRVEAWYADVTRDTVVAAHGGVVRSLMALFGIVSRQQAAHAPIAQGVVYLFADGAMSRYP